MAGEVGAGRVRLQDTAEDDTVDLGVLGQLGERGLGGNPAELGGRMRLERAAERAKLSRAVSSGYDRTRGRLTGVRFAATMKAWDAMAVLEDVWWWR